MEPLMPPKDNSTFEKALRYFVIAISVLFLIFILLSFFKMGLVFWFYDRVFDWVTVRLGFDYYFAQFIAISMTAIFSAMYPYLMWTWFTNRYKLHTTVSIIVVSGIMCLLVYTVGGDVYFDRQTGLPLKWYADTPEGRTFSNSPGYDKKYGTKLKLYTAEIAQREAEAKLNEKKATPKPDAMAVTMPALSRLETRRSSEDVPMNDDSQPIQLNFSNFFPAPHKQSIVMEQYCREIEKRTGGRVKISYFPGGTMSPPTQTYDNIVRGTVDIGESCFAWTRDKFPVMRILDLPLGYKSGIQATKLANAFYARFRPSELNDVKILFLHAHGPGILHTKNSVYTLKSLRGMKIRATGMAAKIVLSFGASPVGITMPETYDALRAGAVDGALGPAEVLQGWKWGEVLRSTTQNFDSAYTTAMFVAMNKTKWNSMPPDVQKIFEEVSLEWALKKGRVWDEIDNESYAYANQKGHRIITLSPEENSRWASAVKPILDEYSRIAQSQGFPGYEALSFCLRYLR